MGRTGNKQISTAVLLIVIGSFLLLHRLHLIYIPWYIFTWQFLLIGIGVVLIITKDRWESGVVLITLGGAFLLPRVIDITFREIWQYWPALLIVIGIVMLIRHLEPNKSNNNHINHGNQQ